MGYSYPALSTSANAQLQSFAVVHDLPKTGRYSYRNEGIVPPLLDKPRMRKNILHFGRNKPDGRIGFVYVTTMHGSPRRSAMALNSRTTRRPDSEVSTMHPRHSRL